MKFDRSQHNGYFELDFGGERLTHYPSGDTCLRHPWMRGAVDAWTQKLKDFLARHPDVNVVINSSGYIIADANDFPQRNSAPFSVGDIVAVREKIDGIEDIGWVSKTVVGSRNTGIETIYDLDDGEELYWADASSGWFAYRHDPYKEPCRVRRPVEGERLQLLSNVVPLRTTSFR